MYYFALKYEFLYYFALKYEYKKGPPAQWQEGPSSLNMLLFREPYAKGFSVGYGLLFG